MITNGDGINNVASPEMIGFAVREKAGIVMVTTTRTQADVKGGILGLSRSNNGSYHADIMEIAQAQATGQEAIFQAMGLSQEAQLLGREHFIGEQIFNTNMAYLNEGLLGDFLSQLQELIGSEELSRIICPDLIQNSKKRHTQLEGAMGSVLLRLNEYVTTNEQARDLWARVSDGSQFLRIINLDQTVRDDFFTPVKTSWDALLQTASDCYELDTHTWRLRNNRTQPVAVNAGFLSSPYYKQLHHTLAAFHTTSLVGVQSLGIYGNAVLLPNLILQGQVEVHSDFVEGASLTQLLIDQIPGLPRDAIGKLILRDKRIYVTETGEVEIEEIATTE